MQAHKIPSGLVSGRAARFTPAPSGEGLWSAGRAELAPSCGLGELPRFTVLRRGSSVCSFSTCALYQASDHVLSLRDVSCLNSADVLCQTAAVHGLAQRLQCVLLQHLRNAVGLR